MYADFSAVSLVTGVIIHAIGTDTEPQWPPFCQQTLPQTSLHSDTTARQFFSEMFTPAVWDLLVDETNRYAHFRLRNPPSCHGILHNWHDTCREEMMSFGLILTMGIVQLSDMKDYWSRHETLHLSFVQIIPKNKKGNIISTFFLYSRSVMSRDRFCCCSRTCTCAIEPYEGLGHLIFTDRFYTHVSQVGHVAGAAWSGLHWNSPD